MKSISLLVLSLSLFLIGCQKQQIDKLLFSQLAHNWRFVTRDKLDNGVVQFHVKGKREGIGDLTLSFPGYTVRQVSRQSYVVQSEKGEMICVIDDLRPNDNRFLLRFVIKDK